MTMDYAAMTDSVLNRVNYGMPSFGYHKNSLVDENYLSHKRDYFGPEIPESKEYEKAANNKEVDDNTGEDYLESLLKNFSEEDRKEVIEALIKERTSLMERVKDKLESQKEHLRDLKYPNSYSLSKEMDLKDVTKQYNEVHNNIIDEERKAWKDIAFLKVKLWDEGIAGGDYNEEKA